MKKFTKKQLTLQAIACSVIATFVVAGVVSATTIGTNVSTAGTLEVTGVSTLTGAVTAGGALTVTGVSTLTGAVTTAAATTVGTDLTVTSGARVGTGSDGGHITALANDSLLIEGQSEFDGIAWFDGSLRASTTLMVTNGATLYSTLNVAGATTLDGDVTLGNATTDVITPTGYLTYARIGTGSTFGHISTVGADELGVEGDVEIDGTAWFDGALTNAGLGTFSGGLTSTATTTISGRIQGTTATLKFDGATANDANYLAIAITDPTAVRTITFPNGTGTVYITDGTDVAVADGGTGLSSYTAGDLIYASNATTLAKLASSSDATILMTDANGWPAWNALSGDATISDAGALTIAANAVAGTDIQLASEAAGDIMYSNGTNWVRLASSTDGLVLTLDSNGWPSWAATIAALNNETAWTAAQKLDEGLTVDTTALIISGAGALTTTQVATLNGGIAVDTTQFTVDGTNGNVTIAAPNTMTTGTLLSAAGGTFSATGAVTGLSVDLSNATGNAQTVYGIDVKDLGTAGAGNEYGIYVEGTDWDQGLYVVDAVKFDGAVTITEGALTDGKVITDDIKDATITTTDISGTAGITAAQLATAAKTNTMAVRMADISVAETLYVMMPKCTVTKISTVLSAAITLADSTITASRNTDAMANGVVTIANVGSAAGVIDSASPTTNNTFDGSTQYLKLVGDGGSTDAAPVIVTIEYTMTD